MLCKCGNERMDHNTLLCDECYQKQKEYLHTRLRDVETYDEDRELFLMRKSRELGLNYTAREIRGMIQRGMTDNLILKTKRENVWTLDGETSKAVRVNFGDVSI